MVAAAAAALDGGVTASDLVPGRYEGASRLARLPSRPCDSLCLPTGGLKLWECAIDLAGFLSGSAAAGCGGADAAAPEAPPALAGARVLELGCGHGLPGVLAALRGAASVTFQDFNAEVLTALTAPNAAANLARSSSSRGGGAGAAAPALRFIAGDWGGMASLLPAASYDVILTADTIYAPATQRRLLALIRHCLAPRGVALVAAKSYYFGVGGRTADFAAAAGGGGALRVRTVARFRDGVSNVREILRLEHAAEAAAS